MSASTPTTGEIEAQARLCEPAQRLMKIRGIGPTTALAIVATVGNAREFKNGRQFAAWIGLVPSQYSTGGKSRLGHISKRGDAYLRNLLVQGARSVLQQRQRAPGPHVALGRSSCRRVAATTERWWRSPTRTRASPGRCSPRTRTLRTAELNTSTTAIVDDETVRPTPGEPDQTRRQHTNAD